MSEPEDDDLRPEYDLAELGPGIRGRYAGPGRQQAGLVLIAPDLRDEFPDDAAVDTALRELLRLRGDSPASSG